MQRARAFSTESPANPSTRQEAAEAINALFRLCRRPPVQRGKKVGWKGEARQTSPLRYCAHLDWWFPSFSFSSSLVQTFSLSLLSLPQQIPEATPPLGSSSCHGRRPIDARPAGHHRPWGAGRWAENFAPRKRAWSRTRMNMVALIGLVLSTKLIATLSDLDHIFKKIHSENYILFKNSHQSIIVD